MRMQILTTGEIVEAHPLIDFTGRTAPVWQRTDNGKALEDFIFEPAKESIGNPKERLEQLVHAHEELIAYSLALREHLAYINRLRKQADPEAGEGE